MSWTDEYWDIMRRAYGEPGKFFAVRKKPLCPACEKSKPPKETDDAEKAVAAMKKLEGSLKDIVNIVFRLAPGHFIPRLLKLRFSAITPTGFKAIGADLASRFGTGPVGVTAPDLMYCSGAATFAMEVRTTSKIKLKQVMDTVVLAALEEARAGKPLSHFLILASPKADFAGLFQEKYRDLAALKTAMKAAAGEGPGKIAVDAAMLKRVADEMRVAHLTFDELGDYLDTWTSVSDSPAQETLNTLMTGLRDELAGFAVVKAPAPVQMAAA